jgi:hypothetical protein
MYGSETGVFWGVGRGPAFWISAGKRRSGANRDWRTCMYSMYVHYRVEYIHTYIHTYIVDSVRQLSPCINASRATNHIIHRSRKGHQQVQLAQCRVETSELPSCNVALHDHFGN